MKTAETGPRHRMRPADRASQLLRVAEETFAEIGFHATTMEEIAHRAGVSRTVLYRHYDSKDALAAACLAKSRDHLRRLMDLPVSISPGVDSRPLIEAGTRAAFTFIRTHARLYSVFLAEGTFSSSLAQAEAEGVRRDVEERAIRLLRMAAPGLSESRGKLLARAVVGASERIAQGLALDEASEYEVEEAVTVVTDSLFAVLPTLTPPHEMQHH